MEKKDAKKAYFSAMANFKKNPPKILKGSKVDFTSSKGRTNYNYASLAEVTQAVSAALAEHGLNVSWRTEQTDGKITVTVRLTHELGYYEETSLTASPDQSGNKNSIQAIASTVSYLERYTLLAITGLATHDMDDDGKGSEVEYISEKQLSTILDMINSKGIDSKKFLAHMHAESCEAIYLKDYEKAISALKRAKGNSNGQG